MSAVKDFYLTRICIQTICHHLNDMTNIEFVVQLLNALFPPYLASYPVPCIDVQEVRAVREKIYLALMDTETQFDGEDGGIEAATLQKDLLTQIGIDSWQTEIYPALNEYFASVESVQKTYDELHNTQEAGLDPPGSDTADGKGLHQANTTMPIVKVRGPDERPDSTASSQSGPIRSILKTSFSSMSGQSISTYASLYGSNSELMMHPLARDLSGLDEHELLRMGLALPFGSFRSNQASFDSLTASPRTLANLRVQLNLADELQMASSAPGTHSISPSIMSECLQSTPAAVNKEDDVFATASGKNEKSKAVDLTVQAPEQEKSSQQDDDHQETTKFPSFPMLKGAKSAIVLRERPAPAMAPAPTPSERTIKLLKSSWKSTECLFAKFKAQEQDAHGLPVVPSLPTNDSHPGSQRRPSKSVRFSDEKTRAVDIVADSMPDRYMVGRHDSNASDAASRGNSSRRPSDPWQYTRDYLLEKIKAEQEGRECALVSPSPEWFAEIDGGVPSRHSISSPRFGRDVVHRIISGSGRTPSLMRTVSSESSVSVTTTGSVAPGLIGELDTMLLHGMGETNQVAVGA